MKISPLVSICIPTYNGEKYLEEALTSVLQQTYRPIELVISDDNSTDRTLEIIDRVLTKADFECRVYHHSPEGMVQNWNYCMRQARGEFIKFLFQDDLLARDCIAAMVAVAQTNRNIGMVFSKRGLLIEEQSANVQFLKKFARRIQNSHQKWPHLRSVQSGKELLAEPYLFDSYFNKVGEPSCVLIRREVVSQVGLFNTAFCHLVDLEYWLRIMMVYDVGFIDRELIQFRLHQDQQGIRNIRSGQSAKEWKQIVAWMWTGPIKNYLHPKAVRKLRRKYSNLRLLPKDQQSLRDKGWQFLHWLRFTGLPKLRKLG